MCEIVKVLNNNALLIYDSKSDSESICLGKGIGFGKKNGQDFTRNSEIKEYHLKKEDTRRKQLVQENSIDTIYLEVAAKIIEEAKLVFEDINSDILLPLADHIAFASKREKDEIYVANPFIPDIKVLFGREYAVAIKCRDYIKETVNYEISDDEAGFIALHIHSGLSNEQASETLRDTSIVKDSIKLVEDLTGIIKDDSSLTYSRLLSHLYYMILRTKTEEKVNIDLNDFMKNKYNESYKMAIKVCSYMEERLGIKLDEMEDGYLAIHIERYLSEK